MKTKSKLSFFTDKPYLIWAILFIIAPLLMVAYYALTDKTGAFSLASVEQIPTYITTILLSVLYGVFATAICLLLGFPFAYIFSKAPAKYQKFVVLLVMLPMWMNFLIRTYSWMTILGDSGVINTILNALGIHSLKLINNGAAVILGMVYNFLPYMILPIFSVLTKLDNSLVEAVVRPEDIKIVKKGSKASLPGKITSVTFKGVHFEILVDVSGFIWMIQTIEHHEVGEEIGMYIEPDAIHIMNRSEYSGEFGDYSYFSDEMDHISDASYNWEEENEDEE